MERNRINKLKIYTWDVSASGMFDRNTLRGFEMLTPQEIAESFIFEESLDKPLMAIITEYFGHGNVRGAAQFVRTLSSSREVEVANILKDLPVEMKEILLEKDLEDLQQSAKDFNQSKIIRVN